MKKRSDLEDKGRRRRKSAFFYPTVHTRTLPILSSFSQPLGECLKFARQGEKKRERGSCFFPLVMTSRKLQSPLRCDGAAQREEEEEEKAVISFPFLFRDPFPSWRIKGPFLPSSLCPCVWPALVYTRGIANQIAFAVTLGQNQPHEHRIFVPYVFITYTGHTRQGFSQCQT